MYESCFQLKRRPFMTAPQLDSYFPAQSIETARQTLTSCIQRGAGPGLVIGPAGTGKTLLCYKLASQFRPSSAVAVLSNTHLCNRRALLQLILFELGLPYRDLDEGELRLSLIDHVTSKDQYPHGMVLLVDEAHSLTLRLLEEIRMLSNVVRDGESRVHVVLAGNAILEERFASPKLEAFNQRVVARSYLRPLNREETLGFVQSQVAAAGGNALDLFTEDAFNAVYQATRGVPRLINQVCDHALILAAAAGLSQLDDQGVEEAWADLQQLPTPMTSGTMSAPGEIGNVIEFGSLEDDDSVDIGQKDGWIDEAHECRPHSARPSETEPDTNPEAGQDTDPEVEPLTRSEVEQLTSPEAEPETSLQEVEQEVDPAETYDSEAAFDAERQLDEIEQRITEFDHDMVAEPPAPDDEDAGHEPMPAETLVSEDTSDEPLAYDPFSDSFEEEEEVVVDCFSLPDTTESTEPTPWRGNIGPLRPDSDEPVSEMAEREDVETSHAEPCDQLEIGNDAEIIDDDCGPTDDPEELVAEFWAPPLAALESRSDHVGMGVQQLQPHPVDTPLLDLSEYVDQDQETGLDGNESPLPGDDLSKDKDSPAWDGGGISPSQNGGPLATDGAAECQLGAADCQLIDLMPVVDLAPNVLAEVPPPEPPDPVDPILSEARDADGEDLGKWTSDHGSPQPDGSPSELSAAQTACAVVPDDGPSAQADASSEPTVATVAPPPQTSSRDGRFQRLFASMRGQ